MREEKDSCVRRGNLLERIENFALEEDNIRTYKINGQGEIRSFGIMHEPLENEVIIL